MTLNGRLLKRRNFLLTSLASAVALAFNRTVRAFNLIPSGATAQSGKVARPPFKVVVVYYSATGNTTKIAKAIHRGMSAAIECDILPLKKADAKKLASYDLVGLGGPIWHSRETANQKLFVHNMPQMPGKLCFLFCTHGAGADGFMSSLSQTVLKRELTIIGWNDWYGTPFQELHTPKPYLLDGHPDDIDLKEAEAFGREMAERAQRIAAGETTLIPETPQGPDADPLWISSRMSQSRKDSGPQKGSTDPAAPPRVNPKIDMAACVYPRCDACVDACPTDAIDMSLMVPGRWASSSLVVKEACISCGLCEKVCIYDAMIFEETTPPKYLIDMKKCTYPRCTLCVDHCPMNCLDLTRNPPVFHHNCERCDLCWCICPMGAIDIPDKSIYLSHLGNRGEGPDGPMHRLAIAESKGKFRGLVSVDKVGWNSPIATNTNTPRILLDDENGNTTYCDKSCRL